MTLVHQYVSATVPLTSLSVLHAYGAGCIAAVVFGLVVEPAPVDKNGPRRSRRTRVQPLDWFRNERILYKARKSGAFSASDSHLCLLCLRLSYSCNGGILSAMLTLDFVITYVQCNFGNDPVHSLLRFGWILSVLLFDELCLL